MSNGMAPNDRDARKNDGDEVAAAIFDAAAGLDGSDDEEQPARGDQCLDDELIAAYLDGQLGPADQAQVHKHLASCEYCRRLVAESVRTLEDLDAMEAETPAAPVAPVAPAEPAAPAAPAAPDVPGGPGGSGGGTAADRLTERTGPVAPLQFPAPTPVPRMRRLLPAMGL